MSLKKYLNIIGILGFLLVIIGIVLNPSILNKIKTIHSDWTIIKIQIISYHFMVIGLIIVVTFLISKNISNDNKVKVLVGGILIVGLAITLSGVIFSPGFAERNFSILKYINEDAKTRLLSFQVLTITLGILISIFASLFLIKKIFNSIRWYGVAILIVFMIIFLLLIQVTYINSKYPFNIILHPKEFNKVSKLLLGQDILLSDFKPRSTLKVYNRVIKRAKFPVIDINFHLSSDFQTEHDKELLKPENLLKIMDSLNIKIIVNTDVKDQDLDAVLDKYARKYPDRFINFWPTGFPNGMMSDEKIASKAGELERVVKQGAKGDGELWKNLGLRTKDSSGKVIPVDDPRLDPFWEKAGELGVPILWHMGDPAASFQKIDRYNERYEGLVNYPKWSFYGSQFPSRKTILKQRENVFKKHPNTIFIGCHFGYTPEDLKYTGYLLDTYPNYYVEISTVLSELGRQPYTARKFFIKYQDRILFGTDAGNSFGVKGWTLEKYYRTHFEFLETDNEFFDYPLQGVIDQGYWKIYGLNLPDQVLEKIYHLNAEKILFGSKSNL